MRRAQVVVVVVHRLGELEQRLAGVAGRPAVEQLVVLDEGPRDVRDDVQADRDDEQADDEPDRREPEARRRGEASRPAPRSGARAIAAGSFGPAGAHERAESEPPDERRRPRTQPRPARNAEQAELDRRRGSSGPISIGAAASPAPARTGARGAPTAIGAPTANRSSSPVHAIGWRTLRAGPRPGPARP